MKFGKQLALIFFAATAIPMFISWFASGEIIYRKEVADVKERHLVIAKNIAVALERYHRDLEASFNLVAVNLLAGNKISNTEQLSKTYKYRHFCLANFFNGIITAQVSSKNAPCPKVIPLKRMIDFQSIAQEGKTVFSPVWAGPGGKPSIYLVRKNQEKIVVGSISTDYFLKTGKAVAFGKKGHAAIVDQTGTVLAHPKPNWVASRKNIAKTSIVKNMLAGKNGVMQFYSPAIKADMIAGYAAVKGAGWGVMVPQPISELRANAALTQRSFFVILAIGILFAGLAVTFAARIFMISIKSVIGGTKEVAMGNSAVKVDVQEGWHVPHELRDLQKHFNTMTKVATEQKLEVEKQLALENAENKYKNEYFVNLAHELKTPLNSILGFSSVLRESKPGALKPHETSEFLGHIEKSATHLLLFVNDLLDLNRLEMGAQKLNEHTFHLTDPIRFCEATLRRQIVEKHICLKVDFPNKDLTIFADERAMNQMLINLVSNAVRYSFEKGKITISAEELDCGRVKIEVSDHGIGIPEEDISEIMLPFKRSNDPQIAEIHGTGLGLSIVNRLAHLHNIDFKIESEHGFSTTASLIIPADRISENNGNKKAA